MLMSLDGPTLEQSQALTGLVERGVLNPAQADAVRGALFGPNARRPTLNPTSVLIEIAGYVGGGLILGGALLLVQLNLERLGQDNAALVLAGYALTLLVAGVLIGGGLTGAARLRDGHAPVRRRLVGVLFAIAAGPAALATALVDPVPRHTTLVAGLVGFAVAVAGYALLSTVPGVLAIAATAITVTAGILEFPEFSPRSYGMVAYVGLGLLFGLAATVRLIKPRRIGLALGAAIAIVGAHLGGLEGADRAWTYGLTFLIGLCCFVSYWLDRATVLLVFGVIATSIAIPEAVTDWTDDALSGPAILLVSGTVLVAVSGLGLWLRTLRGRVRPSA